MQSGRTCGLWLWKELGIRDVVYAGRDVHTLNAMRASRMFGYGAIALILAKYFALLGFSDPKIGWFMTLTLFGDVFLTALTTSTADKVGRRTMLMLWSLVMAVSGVIFAVFENFYILLVAAILGVISPSGNEVGPFRGVEESIVAHLVEPHQRTAIYSGYVVLAGFGSALGLIAGGNLSDALQKHGGWSELDAYRSIFWVYAALGVANVVLTLLLSPHCEISHDRPQPGENAGEEEPLLGEPLFGESANSSPIYASTQQNGDASGQDDQKQPSSFWSMFSGISRKSLPNVVAMCLLFALDSFASGMTPYSLINYYVELKFGISKTTLSYFMSVAMFISMGTTILATPLVKRVGHIKAMVSVHLLAAIFLGLIPVGSSLALTFAFNCLRTVFNPMDQAPRSAFIASVVLPNERTAVNGIVMVVKTLSTSIGPAITGVLAGKRLFWVSFVIAGATKALYDLGLLVVFEVWKIHERKEVVEEEQSDDEQPVL